MVRSKQSNLFLFSDFALSIIIGKNTWKKISVHMHGEPTFGHVVTGAVRSAPVTQAFKRFQAGALPDVRFFLG